MTTSPWPTLCALVVIDLPNDTIGFAMAAKAQRLRGALAALQPEDRRTLVGVGELNNCYEDVALATGNIDRPGGGCVRMGGHQEGYVRPARQLVSETTEAKGPW